MHSQSFLIINLQAKNQNHFEFSLCRLLKTDPDALLLGGIHHSARAWFNRFYFDFFALDTPDIFQLTSIVLKPRYRTRLTPPQTKALGLEHTLKLQTSPLDLETLASKTITLFRQLPN